MIPNGFLPKNFDADTDKVIFLNDKNLSEIKGYKAIVQHTCSVLPDKLKRRNASVIIKITGLSNKSCLLIVEKLEALKPEEVFGK